MKQLYRVSGQHPIVVASGEFAAGAEGVVLTEHEANHLRRTGAVELMEAGPAIPAAEPSGPADTSASAPKARKQ